MKKELLNQFSGATLWHCSAGKDRAGFATILVLYLLDFDWEVIIEDYLATNLFYQDTVDRLVLKYGDDYLPILESLFGVCKEYIDGLLIACDELYGGFDNYINNILDFNLEKKERLKEIYLI